MDNSMSADQLQQLVALGVIPDKQRALDQQMELANQLRTTPMPKGQMAGRVFVGDPLGALAAGVERYQGNKQLKKLRGKQDELLNKQNAARMAYVQALRGQQAQPQGAPPGGMTPAGDQGNGVTTYPMQQ